MKILFITRLYYPHVGGVEKHVQEVKKSLTAKGYKVTVISEENIKYPHIKFLGLISIWFWLFKNRNLIEGSDVIHIHDVFIWYFPFCLLYPKKSVFTTLHGFEWDFPRNKISVFQKRLAVNLSNGTFGVGKFLEKYLHVTFNKIIYGAADLQKGTFKKQKDHLIFVGRLEENTGILQFLDWLKVNPKYKVEFCGDGPLRVECEKYGRVHGFTDPTSYYKKAEYCVPGGYLAGLEALSYNCKLKLFWNNKVKEDYWKMSPFFKLKGEKLKSWARKQTWDKLADEYLDLYNHAK
jgi:glycosyltransferase involved in cell wall biosynthesis